MAPLWFPQPPNGFDRPLRVCGSARLGLVLHVTARQIKHYWIGEKRVQEIRVFTRYDVSGIHKQTQTKR